MTHNEEQKLLPVINYRLSVFSLARRGFSLLEILMVVAILAILGVSGVGYYRNLAKNVETKNFSQTLVSDLKYARSLSTSGESSLRWGVHAVNGASDYYEFFSSSTTYSDSSMSVSSTTTLPKGVSWVSPAESASKDIIFTRISGTTTADTLIINSESGNTTLTITSLGVVY